MDILILQGSPRENGNTASLVRPFKERLEEKGMNVEEILLHGLDINPCIACRSCQKDWDEFGCIYEDDMQMIYEKVLEVDMIIFATPIYSWTCTAPMKVVMDRLVYVMNKFYGDQGKGPALCEGKQLGLVTTCGYPVDKGVDLFDESLKRYARHFKMEYIGFLGERHMGYNREFMDEEKKVNARKFADKIISLM